MQGILSSVVSRAREIKREDLLERAFNGSAATGNISLPQPQQPEPFHHASLQHQEPVIVAGRQKEADHLLTDQETGDDNDDDD